ncbi:MAG: helix-turn-helix transcriptional regulator [Novosphingobium sp.]
MARRRLLEELHLLCSCGAGLEAIAVPACTLLRDLSGADSASCFWLDDKGQPGGFYHDTAPAELKDLFVTRFDDLFSSPDEINMVKLIAATGPSMGQYIDGEGRAAFRECNVYRYLAAPLGQHYFFEMRIDAGGKGVALMCLWNGIEKPFDRKLADRLEPAQAMLQRAAARRDGAVRWQASGAGPAQLATDMAGEKLYYIDETAEHLLLSAHLLRQNLPMVGELNDAPLFCRQLAGMVDAGSGNTATLHLPVFEGRLTATAKRARRVAAENGDEWQMFVSIEQESPLEVRAVQRAAAYPLTLLQKEVLLFGMSGGSRTECAQHFGLGAEALKKHVRAILAATGCERWQDLPELAGAEASRP